ncbi:MAG: rhodanese-like domain-containing protein [Polyangiaceae bacterium]|nr:rhodanese-like domain-containing protein [Polyangiaceae bacterium]MCW5789013.1 rhodanese-like domain-containing protein [Polyangiaceae bacterium]
MDVEDLDADQVEALLAAGRPYLDVRSEPEFVLGHPVGAYNVPLLFAGSIRFELNPRFAAVVLEHFHKEELLILGCRSGNRSLEAAEVLARAGFQRLAHLAVGFDGRRDAFGRRAPGWARLGKPVEVGDGGPRSYQALAASVR